jgi:hypothetical protein
MASVFWRGLGLLLGTYPPCTVHLERLIYNDSLLRNLVRRIKLFLSGRVEHKIEQEPRLWHELRAETK